MVSESPAVYPPQAGAPAAAAARAAVASDVVDAEVTRLSPLYLQHAGHSRTVVGAERRGDGEVVLLVLDPSASRLGVESNLALGTTRSFCYRASAFQRHRQYQLLFLDGVYATAEQQRAATVITSIRA